jgi:hypothetical protein
VLTFKVDATIGAMATFAGLAVATVLFLFYDPVFRLRTPLDYPRNVEQWIAIVLFDLSFNQLFLTFAPLAWLLRLTQNLRAAIVLTVLFGIVVLLIKVGRSPIPPSTGLFIELVLVRLVIGVCTILFYLRGGLLLAWWWGFLLDARHLLALGNAPAGS